ncbi:MAG TPA: FtsQ-type POTRA domain-containing protein [Candidatus Dormibacteraeota bacterium]
MTVGTIEKRRGRTAAAPPAPVTRSRGWVWAVVQLAVLGTEIFVTLFLLAQSSFRPRDVRITGIRHVSVGDVESALALPVDQNIFFLSHRDLERRVETLPWIRSASVSLALPDRVAVRVSEWTPSAVLQVGEATYDLNDAGQVLDPATEAGKLLIINRPDLETVKSGQRIVAPELLAMLQQLRAGFQPAFRVSITSFTIDGRDVLSAQTDRGWTLVFGQMLTAGDRATLEPKVAALHALSGRLDLTSTQILYINLENPGAPAVQMRGKR